MREGHVPCPDTYMLTMISDFSRQLGPTSMSAWIAGAGDDGDPVSAGKIGLHSCPC